MHSAEEVDTAIQEISAQFEKLLHTNKNSGSDSGRLEIYIIENNTPLYNYVFHLLVSEASLALYVLMFVFKAYFILLTSFHRTAETALNVNPVCERTNEAMYNFL